MERMEREGMTNFIETKGVPFHLEVVIDSWE
jgi:hypothetical protein